MFNNLVKQRTKIKNKKLLCKFFGKNQRFREKKLK